MPTAVEFISNHASAPAAEAFSNVSEGLQAATAQTVQGLNFQDAIEAFRDIPGQQFDGNFISSAQSEMNPLSHLQSMNDSSQGGVPFFGGISSADVLQQINNPELDLGASLTKFSDSLQQGAAFAGDLSPEIVQSESVQKQGLLATVISNLANMRHEMLKAVAQNLRA